MTKRTVALSIALGVALATLAACSAVRQGPDPYPGVGVRFVAHVNGAADAQVLADAVPLSALVKVTGTYTLTARPLPPFLTVDGTGDLIVEPTAGQEEQALRAVQRGDIVIVRAGARGLLNRPGTAAARRTPPPVMSSIDVAPVYPKGEVCEGGACAVTPK